MRQAYSEYEMLAQIAQLMCRYSRAIGYIAVGTGGMLVDVGIMLCTGTLERLAQFGFFVDFGL